VLTGICLVTGSSKSRSTGKSRSTFLNCSYRGRKHFDYEPLVTAYQSTRCRSSQDLFLPQHRCEISQTLGCIQARSLALQKPPCTTESGIIRAHRKLRRTVVSTKPPYFFPSSLRDCSCGVSLCYSHSVLYSGVSWICISGWLSA